MKHLHSTQGTRHISEDSSCLAREARRLSTSFGTAFSHDLFSYFIFIFLQSQAFQMHQVQTIFSDSDNISVGAMYCTALYSRAVPEDV